MSQNLDFSKFTKEQLKDQLRARELKLGGNKPELIARLQAAITGVPEVVVQAAPAAQTTLPPPVMPGPIGLPLVPTGPATKGRGAPKKPAKTPTEVVVTAVKDSGLSLEASLAAVLSVYGLQEFLATVVKSLGGDIAGMVPPTAPLPETYEGLKEMKVEDLKKILKTRGEKVGGKKEELIQRILNPTPQAAAGAPGQMALPPLGELPPIPPMVHPLPTASPLKGGMTLPQAFPTVPGLPGALPTIPGLPTAALPTLPVAALPTIPGLPTLPVAALPTVPGLPTLPVAALPTIPGLPTTLPGMPAGDDVDTAPNSPVGSPKM